MQKTTQKSLKIHAKFEVTICDQFVLSGISINVGCSIAFPDIRKGFDSCPFPNNSPAIIKFSFACPAIMSFIFKANKEIYKKALITQYISHLPPGKLILKN